MRIGFDAKRAVCNSTGLGNYSRLIIDSLSDYYPDNEYLLYTPKLKNNSLITPILQHDNVVMHLPIGLTARNLSSLWRVNGITNDLLKDSIDLFHGLSSELPLSIASSGIPSVVTVHDLIFRRYPHYYNPIDVKIYNYKFRKSCENATRIIAISECTKRDIMSYYHIEESKIDVVYQGCDEAFRREISDEELANIKKEYSLPDHYILNVGTIEDRKNIILAIKSLKNLPENIHLVVVGRKTAYFDKVMAEIETLHLQHRVHFYHGLPFTALPAFYHLAEVFVYPSRFEGFGIPMLEALCCGIPAIGAIGSSLEEAGGPDSLYVNPDDWQSLSKSIIKVIGNNWLRQNMIEQGKKYSEKFSREAVARNTMKVYEKVFQR